MYCLGQPSIFPISGVFSLGSIPDNPTRGGDYLQTSVMAADFQAYLGVVFENTENTVQSWHIDGHTLLVGLVLWLAMFGLFT